MKRFAVLIVVLLLVCFTVISDMMIAKRYVGDSLSSGTPDIPEENTSLTEKTDPFLEEATISPEESTSLPTEDTTIPEDTSLPEEETSVPEEHYPEKGIEGLRFLLLDNDSYGVSVESTAQREYYQIPSVYRNKPVTEILRNGFQNTTSLKFVMIPDSIKIIGDHAFSGCTSLEYVVFGKGSQLSHLESSAFSNCISLKSFSVPAKLRRIEKSTFYRCTALSSVTFFDNNHLERIEQFAFYECTSLKNVSLAQNTNLITIESHAFYRCIGLTSIEIPESVLIIENGALKGCDSLVSITLPFVGTDANKAWQGYFSDIFGGVEKVPKSLHSVVVTNATSVSSYAFEYCSDLTSIIFSDRTVRIDYAAFRDCERLQTVRLSSKMTKISENLFFYCSSLETIHVPENVTDIGENAFFNCIGLTSIVLPKGLKTVGESAFTGMENLSVYYGGTAEDWESIDFASENDALVFATRYYYSETPPDSEGNYWHYVNGVPAAW